MAITFDYNEKCGEATFRNYKTDLYTGNCFLIMLVNKDLHSFFVDKDHMERCLENGIYNDLVSISINKAKCRNWKQVLLLLTEYCNNVEIKVYSEGEKTYTEKRETETIPNDRFKEIAETAISYLLDNDMFEDYMEDRDMEFNSFENEYFCIDMY